MILSIIERRAEWNYRRSERMAILAEDRLPTSEQAAIATKEADEWLANYNRQAKKLSDSSCQPSLLAAECKSVGTKKKI